MRFFANIFLALFAISAFSLVSPAPQAVLASPGNSPSLTYLALRQDKESGGLVEEGETEPSAIQSAWGAIAYAGAGFDPDTVGSPSLLHYVEKDACSYTNVTDIERTILVALASERDPRNFGGCNMLSLLNALANEDGSIGPDIISTIFGTIAKSASGEEVEEKTFNFIINAQEEDGGWDSGWGTEANITAQALIALSYSRGEQSDTAIARAKDYLKRLQTNDGGIKYDNNSWTSSSDAFSNAYTLQAIYALGEKETDDFWLSTSGKTIADNLLSLRGKDGFYNFSLPFGAVNPVFTTAIAVPPLYGKTLGFVGNNLIFYSANNEQENDSLPTCLAEETPAQEDVEKKAQLLVRTPSIVVAYNENDAVKKDNVDEPQKKIQPLPPSAPLSNEESNNKLVSILVVCGSALIGLALSFALGKLKIFSLLVALAIFYPLGAQAGQAGVVVRHGSGKIVTKCVDFGTQENMTGVQLLEKSGLNPQFYNGFIFAINGESAKKYNEPGAGDDYWSYWHADNIGNWLYSSLGPKNNKVNDGEVDGWQRGGSSLLLPTIKLSDICPALEVQAPLSPTSEHSTPPNNTQEEKLTQETVASSNKTTESKQTLPLKIDEGKQESTANKKDNLPSWLLPTTLCAFLLGLLLPRIIKK